MTNFCPECFGDKSLRSQLTKARPKYPDGDKCDFHPNRKCIPEHVVAEMIDSAIRSNYGWADTNPYVDHGDSLSDLIDELVQPDSAEILEAIKRALEESEEYDIRKGGESFYDDSQKFIKFESTYNPLEEMWARFKYDIVHQQRFFSQRGIEWLKAIFSDLEHQKDSRGQSPIYTVGPGEPGWTIFRARRRDTKAERDKACAAPAAELGPPPERLRRAGRLNAPGVACFYGAFDVDTCLAEIRPPVGSWAVTAAFELLRPITVLDMTRFTNEVANRSIFSPLRQKRLDQWRFMQVFQEEITRPILPDDEVLDYVPTQAVSEFIHVALAAATNSTSSRIDGVIYGSAQRPGSRNIALFGEAALVSGVPDEPKEALSRAAQSGLWDDGAGYIRPSPKNMPGPDAALGLRQGSVGVHQITGVDIRWKTHEPDDDLDNNDF
jgi:hypothetical protein